MMRLPLLSHSVAELARSNPPASESVGCLEIGLLQL